MTLGRPIKWTAQYKEKVLSAFIDYIDSADIPIIAEFCYMNNMDRKRLYENEAFSHALKMCIAKKESMLEKGALTRVLESGMAKFSLMQIGWRTHEEVEHSGDVNVKVNIVD